MASALPPPTLFPKFPGTEVAQYRDSIYWKIAQGVVRPEDLKILSIRIYKLKTPPYHEFIVARVHTPYNPNITFLLFERVPMMPGTDITAEDTANLPHFILEDLTRACQDSLQEGYRPQDIPYEEGDIQGSTAIDRSGSEHAVVAGLSIQSDALDARAPSQPSADESDPPPPMIVTHSFLSTRSPAESASTELSEPISLLGSGSERADAPSPRSDTLDHSESASGPEHGLPPTSYPPAASDRFDASRQVTHSPLSVSLHSAIPSSPGASQSIRSVLNASSASTSGSTRLLTGTEANDKVYLIQRYPKDWEAHFLAEWNFSKLSLPGLTVIASLVQDKAPLYDLLHHQCYWFVNLVTRVAEEVGGGERVSASQQPDMSSVCIRYTRSKFLLIKVGHIRAKLVRVISRQYYSVLEENIKTAMHGQCGQRESQS